MHAGLCSRDIGLLTTVCALTLLSGCGPHRMAAPTLPSGSPVKWVFDAGSQIQLLFHLFPQLGPGYVDGAGAVDDKIIVLCNIGGASEVLQTSQVCVLDRSSGSVLKCMLGPSQTGREWAVAGANAYIYDQRQHVWLEFDTAKGVTAAVNDPAVPASRPILDWNRIRTYDEGGGDWEADLGKSRRLAYARCPASREIVFDLLMQDANGNSVVVPLAQLPVRQDWTSNMPMLVGEGEADLVCAVAGYVIALDKTKLPSCAYDDDSEAVKETRNDRVR